MRFACLLLIVFCHYNGVLAQNTKQNNAKETIALAEFFKKLEEIHHIRFSYNAALIENKSISASTDMSIIENTIAKIENDFDLVFEKIDERYYIIKTKTMAFCGYLKDKTTNMPIEGVNIANLNSQQGTSSDTNGYFSFESNNATDTISMSFIGYKTIRIPLHSTPHKNCATYFMITENTTLEEIVIQEYLGAGFVKINDGSIKINPKKLEILSGLSEPDILQNIQLLPGIESPLETASGLYIRGGSPDQNLILWDGIKMYNSSHFFGMISAFNPYIIKNVNVSRSGANPKYGDRVSGVIDIVSDDNIPEKTEVQAGVNMLQANTHLKLPISKKIGVMVSARHSVVDLFRSPTFLNFSNKVLQNVGNSQNQSETTVLEEEHDFDFSDITLKTIYKPSNKDQITSSTLITSNRLDYRLNVEAFNNTFEDELSIKNYGATVAWERNWSDRFRSKTRFYYSQYDFKYNGQIPFLENVNSSKKQNNIKEKGAFFHTDWKLNHRFSFANGYQFFSNRVAYNLESTDENGTLAVADDRKNSSHTIYNQVRYKPTHRWKIDVGLRTSFYTSLNTLYLEPRIYVERKLGDYFRLKASAEIKNQAISKVDEYTTQNFGLENKIWVLTQNNSIIPLLNSEQLAAGFLFSKSEWHLDVDAYYKNLSGITSFTNGVQSSINGLINGNSTVKGIDVLLKKKINNYVTWLGYTYATTNFIFEPINNGKEFRGNNDIRHSLTWSHFCKWKRFQFSLGWKYRTGTLFTPAIGINSSPDINPTIEYGAFNSEVLPDYHRLDFSVRYDFKLSNKINGKLGFSLLNLYNKKNILSKDYTLIEDKGDAINTASLKEINRYSLARTPNVFFRITF